MHWHLYTACMNLAPKGSSPLQRFEHGNMTEVCNGLISPRLPHIITLHYVCNWMSYEGKRVVPCLNKSLHSDHCLQGGSEPGMNGLDNLYIPTSSLAICFSVLEDSGLSAVTCLDTERHTCPQPAAFFSRRTHIMPSTYVYTHLSLATWYLQSP